MRGNRPNKSFLPRQLIPMEGEEIGSAANLHRIEVQDLLVTSFNFKKDDSSSNNETEAEEREDYNYRSVPIFVQKRKTQWMELNPRKIFQSAGYYPRFARGILVGNNNLQVMIRQEMDFVGNFEGVFQSGQPVDGEAYFFYFEGTISDMQFLRIQGQQMSFIQQNQYRGLTFFKGYFKGLVLESQESESEMGYELGLLKNLTKNQILQYEQKFIRSKVCRKTDYYVPAFARFEIGKIRQICLQKSSAEVWGTLFLSVQMNKEIAELFQVEWEQKRKSKFHVNFNRSPPFQFPFYDPSEFEETEDETEYEWDDIWEGIHWTLSWNVEKYRMQYEIQTKFTVEMDNSYGIFFAPFNLNTLKLTVTLHSIAINSDCTMHISVGDLHDFNEVQQGLPKQYHPYTQFSRLSLKDDEKQLQDRYRKHIDRLTKISSPSGRDMGEYKIATNKLFLFPYHNRVLANKNTQTSDYSWTLGLSSRTAYFNKPEILSVRESYQRALQAQKKDEEQRIEVFRVQRWNYIHIEIPIYKYPVIDMIRIFVPIVILSSISLIIFGQENGEYNGLTLFARRIASSCNILIAYVALIPLIRSKLPPSPSLTLVEIVIYLSTVPNFLAVLSVYLTGSLSLIDFYSSYQPFLDGLFLVSFLICSISFVICVVFVSIYISQNYLAEFTFRWFKPSKMNRLCSPFYLEYMDRVQKIRKEIMMHKRVVFYEEE